MRVLPFYISSNIEKGSNFINDSCFRNNVSYSFLHVGGGFVVSNDLIHSKDVDVLLTYYDGVVTLENTPCQYYLTKRSKFLQSLEPVDEIKDIVDQIKNNYFKNRLMIGVHFRTHDSRFDWNVVPPIGNAGSAHTFGEGATLQDFYILLNMLANHFKIDSKSNNNSTNNNDADRNSYIKFFIASNSDEVKRNFTAQFPESVSLVGDLSRDSAQGMKFAFIEWLLLSETDLIINTHGSSYAVEAAGRQMVPVIGIWGGLYIYHTDIRLPYCGHLQFVRVFSQQGHSKSYIEEGTIDNREVAGRVIALRESNAFELWGIPTVYCTTTDEVAKTLRPD
jgi:hypothetical protein